MIYKSITIAIFAACSLLACGGGGSATPAVPMPPAVVSGLFVFAGSHDTAGAQDGNALEARFQSPGGIKSDASGNIYLADNNAIRKISRFGSPRGIALDLAGNVFVVDASAFTIRKISPAGVVTTVAGVALRSGYALGNLPGMLDLPGSLAVIGTNTLITNSGYSLLKIVLP